MTAGQRSLLNFIPSTPTRSNILLPLKKPAWSRNLRLRSERTGGWPPNWPGPNRPLDS